MTAPPARDLTPFTMAALAALALAWVLLDQFGILEDGSTLSAIVAFLPFALWVAIVVWRQVPRPFSTLVRIGIIHGVMLAVVYQVMWDGTGSGYPPFIGNTVSEMPEIAREVVVRAFAVVTSVLTGALLGVITGIAAWGVSRFVRPPELYQD